MHAIDRISAACWAHARRKFFDLAQINKAPIAIEAVERIDALFAIEREINGMMPQERVRVRNERSRSLVIELERWLREQRARVSKNSETGKAIDYSLKRWSALTRFLDDGRLCMSNNAAERELRAIATMRSLCTPSSSIWEHWNLIFEIDATRAAFSPERSGDPFVLEVAGADLVRSARHDLFGSEHTILDEAADPVVGDVELCTGFGHREPFAVLVGGAVGTNAVHPPQ